LLLIIIALIFLFSPATFSRTKWQDQNEKWNHSVEEWNREQRIKRRGEPKYRDKNLNNQKQEEPDQKEEKRKWRYHYKRDH
jgi:hypothetical protein